MNVLQQQKITKNTIYYKIGRGKKRVNRCIFPLIYRFDVFLKFLYMYISHGWFKAHGIVLVPREIHISKEVTLECSLNWKMVIWLFWKIKSIIITVFNLSTLRRQPLKQVNWIAQMPYFGNKAFALGKPPDYALMLSWMNDQANPASLSSWQVFIFLIVYR